MKKNININKLWQYSYSKIACRCGYPADNNISTNVVPKNWLTYKKMTKKDDFERNSKKTTKYFDFLLYIV
jgi:hypothetical protein